MIFVNEKGPSLERPLSEHLSVFTLRNCVDVYVYIRNVKTKIGRRKATLTWLSTANDPVAAGIATEVGVAPGGDSTSDVGIEGSTATCEV